MEEYIIEEEEYLSPVVVVTTVFLVLVFGAGMLYQLMTFAT